MNPSSTPGNTRSRTPLPSVRWPPRAAVTLLTLAAATACIAPLTAAAQEAGDGARLVWQYHCSTCHGINGRSNSSRYPHLAGQNAPYLEARLKYFRDRVEPGNLMNAQAAGLTDSEITALALYFSARR
jgi:cytochrome c553